MCGRYTLRASPVDLAKAFALFREAEYNPRYNVAPTQTVPVIRATESGRELSLMRWGLIPSWSKDSKDAARMINAHAETITEKPSFRTPFKRRRCLIPADGFYEWKKVRCLIRADAFSEWKRVDGSTKQPYLIELKSGEPFAFAGLWESWKSPNGSPVGSCSIITTDANELVADKGTARPVPGRGDELPGG